MAVQDYMGPGPGLTADDGAAGPPAGGQPAGRNVIGAWPGDLDGDEFGEGFDRDLLLEHLRGGGTQAPSEPSYGEPDV